MRAPANGPPDGGPPIADAASDAPAPLASFTIVDLTDTGGDQAIVKQVLLWFDVTCLDAGVSGCLAYGM